jgi:hypothetical protein
MIITLAPSNGVFASASVTFPRTTWVGVWAEVGHIAANPQKTMQTLTKQFIQSGLFHDKDKKIIRM